MRFTAARMVTHLRLRRWWSDLTVMNTPSLKLPRRASMRRARRERVTFTVIVPARVRRTLARPTIIVWRAVERDPLGVVFCESER